MTNVTTGPGGTNAITGVLGQYLDSIPGLYISGQIKTSTYKHTYPYLILRQLGDQEADIVSVVTPITKYAKTVYNPLDIKYELDKDFIIDMIKSELISNGYGNVYVSIINWNSSETELHTIFEF